MNPLSGSAKLWYKHKYQRKRTNGFRDRGHWVKLAPAYSWHMGNFIAPSAVQLQRLPEGARIDGSQTLYTGADLLTVAAGNQYPDHVLFNGIEYEVTDGQLWASHNWYILTKVGQ